MSGFLTRLLDRTIEAGPVLRTRPQALFERPRGRPAGGLSAGSPWPSESHAFTPAPVRHAPASTMGERSSRRADVRDASVQPGERDERRAAPVVLPRTPLVPSPVSPREPEPVRPRAASRPAAPDSEAEVPRTTRRRGRVESAQAGAAQAGGTAGRLGAAPRPREAPRPPAIARSIAPAAPVTAALAPSPRAPAPPAERGGAGKPPPAATAPTSPPRRGEPRQAQRLISQRRAAIAPAVAGPRLLRAEPQAPPAVHVTIGRLEVRASSPLPTPPPRAVAPQAPKLGLDEYLRARSGGTR
jgi:hypothetical protein